MRLRSIISLLVFALVFVVLLLLPTRAHAQPIQYSGTLELRSPVWASRSGFTPDISFLDFAGSLRLTRAGSRWALWANGEKSFSRGYFVHESKAKIGVDYRLRQSWTLFSYFDERFDSSVERVFVGVKFGFRGDLD